MKKYSHQALKVTNLIGILDFYTFMYALKLFPFHTVYKYNSFCRLELKKSIFLLNKFDRYLRLPGREIAFIFFACDSFQPPS